MLDPTQAEVKFPVAFFYKIALSNVGKTLTLFRLLFRPQVERKLPLAKAFSR